MNKETILEAMYKTLQSSMEWSLDAKENEYANYVNGVLDMTEAALNRVENDAVSCDHCSGNCGNC